MVTSDFGEIITLLDSRGPLSIRLWPHYGAWTELVRGGEVPGDRRARRKRRRSNPLLLVRSSRAER
jgi:hypothetical protein